MSSVTDNTPTTAAPTLNIPQALVQFKENHRPKIAILTPSYNGQVTLGYLYSLINTLQYFQQQGIPIQVEFCKHDSLITRARNNLVAKALSDPEITHLLFIDADIQWDVVEIAKLLLADKFIVGGAYPLKKYFFDRLIPKSPEVSSPASNWIQQKQESILKDLDDGLTVVSHLLNYNTNLLPDVVIERNLAKVRHVASGFMMIKRGVFAAMMNAHPEWKYKDNVDFLTAAQEPYSYAFFDTGVVDGRYESEDWMFCNRWQSLGGSVYLDVSINLAHIGSETYFGNYLLSLLPPSKSVVAGDTNAQNEVVVADSKSTLSPVIENESETEKTKTE